MNQELLLLEDVCTTLHIGKTTAYKLINSKLLPARKIGGKWLIRPADLDKYIETTMHTQTN